MLDRREVLALGGALAVTALVPAAVAQPVGADVSLLQALLRLEHSAVHGYGRLGPLLAPALRELARVRADVHRLQRDSLRSALVARNADAPVAEPAYVLPVPVTGPATAVTAALALEELTLLGYHAALPQLSDPPLRALCAQLMAQAAISWTEVSRARGDTVGAATTAFPGRR